ncbi:kinesin motor domain containing protein [Nitzschia inconspicua]|uniref:Kinesin motor domain containing protein n=1 Tax=Nitzschia inconspicua TaxID=303405 RepID=A0A9K3LLV9_9STRA|nr:kinesin motor domain containing protein [Nitzschia inconspicua]
MTTVPFSSKLVTGCHRPNKESRVQVGVRIRPLTSKEIQSGGKSSLVVHSPSIRMGQRQFTYDSVFDESCGQKDLYDRVSGPLLSSFMDGYNATIMSYGQTGSGKTYTMGSEAHTEPESSSQSGLIPRFITDFFLRLQHKKAVSDSGEEDGNHVLLDYNLKASFLEVYGEDVYDLLDATRESLPLREDSEKGIVVVGLKSRTISSTAEALQVLHEGTMNRTTAATLMNLTSSRSHAVFTIELSQITRSNNGGKVDVTTTSCFTFVDLAGSERMKKTGAEGERAREGIKINEGLLALGNVINALADEERLAQEKKVHVPYRQSKLTRLLQDALGGNSQTLFLACVSPSDTNASETLSTLNYANRARNIRNAPTKNVDATLAQMQRLYAINRVLQSELIKSRFTSSHLSIDTSIGKIDDSLLQREDVHTYMQQIYYVASEMTSPSKTLPPIPAPSKSREDNPNGSPATCVESTVVDIHRRDIRSEPFDDSVLDDVNPDEEMAILDYLLELQQQDQEFETEKKNDDEKLKEVNGQIEKEEAMLLQLRESLKVYHGLKSRYEELMAEVQQLETEKTDLAKQLEHATVDPTIGCSAAIKQKLERVEMNLNRARRETMSHREKYHRAEDQSRKCHMLERKVRELKQAKIALIKKQKHAEARYREMTEAKTKELMVLKRRETLANKKMSKLEHELRLQKTTLDKRKKYCDKLSEKLNQTEARLLKLLAIRQRNLPVGDGVAGRNMKAGSLVYDRKPKPNHDHLKSLSEDEMKASSYIFSKMVVERVKQSRLKARYEDLVKSYGETMRKLVSEIRELVVLRKDSTGGDDDADCATNSVIASEKEENVADLELKVELLETEMQHISAAISDDLDGTDEAVTKLMMGMSDAALRSLLLNTFSKFVSVETDRQTLSEILERKESALLSFEAEIESLNFKVGTLSRDLANRTKLEASGEDPFHLLNLALEEKRKMEEQLQSSNEALIQSTADLTRLRESEREAKEALLVERETLAVMRASSNSLTNNVEAHESVEKLQAVWSALGVDAALRESVNRSIERSLEDTCLRELNKAQAMKSSCETEIKCLCHKLSTMKRAMGIMTLDKNESTSNVSLLSECKSLRDEVTGLETRYRFSVVRRGKILKELKQLMPTLGLTAEEVDSDLQMLLRDDKSSGEMDIEFAVPGSPMETESFVALPPNSLETNFLSSCESGVRKLRAQKSIALVRNRELQQQISDLIDEMHLASKDAIELILSLNRKNKPNLEQWWDQTLAEEILRCLVIKKFSSDPSEIISRHLEFLRDTFVHVASSRRSVSTSLKTIIEKAQKTLLDIVGREFDASEAYAGFHDALFRLPALSKDLILSCISEMEALTEGVDSMTQSEIEALTVIWEALKIPASDRRNFWGQMEKADSKKLFSQKSLFPDETMKEVMAGEDWIGKSVNRALEVYGNLEQKLRKLESIHKEVERLRSKQDAKSKILSLDSEIRIMNAKLLDFEEHCNKQRLLTKKTSGGALLKEERFRKQMQSKFVSNLRQLANLLQAWEAQESKTFDSSLLSEDVRTMLQNPDHMESWVAERTKFMGLRTVKSQTPNKRPFASLGSQNRQPSTSKRQASGLTPPRRRPAQPLLIQPAGGPSRHETNVAGGSRKNSRGMGLDNNTLRVRDSNVEGGQSQKHREKKREDPNSIRPFENILSEMTSPS